MNNLNMLNALIYLNEGVGTGDGGRRCFLKGGDMGGGGNDPTIGDEIGGGGDGGGGGKKKISQICFKK